MKRKLLVVLLFAFTVISFTVIFAACSQDGDKTPPDPGTDPGGSTETGGGLDPGGETAPPEELPDDEPPGWLS